MTTSTALTKDAAAKVQFLTTVTNCMIAAAKDSEADQQRKESLGQALEVLAGHKDGIRQAFAGVRSTKYGLKQTAGSVENGVIVNKVSGDNKDSNFNKKDSGGAKALSGKGQEHDLDTFKSTREGRGLRGEDLKAIGEQMKHIAEAVHAILDRKGKDGQPLFKLPEEEDIARKMLTEEVFSPLVREGVLPDNFVNDPYSEVQQLLNNTFARYKETNREAQDEQELSHAKAKGKYHGGSTGLDQFGAGMSRLASAPTRLADKMGVGKTARRRLGIALESGQALLSLYEMGNTLQSWQLNDEGKPKIEANFAKQLGFDTNHAPGKDPDELRTELLQEKRAASIKKLKLPEGTEKLLINALNLQENSKFASSTEGIVGGGGEVLAIITDLALPGHELDLVRKALNSADHEATNVIAALAAAKEIGKVLVKVLDDLLPGAGTAVAGSYEDAVDTAELASAAGENPPNGEGIVEEFALAFESVLSAGLGADLKAVGKAVMTAFTQNASGKQLGKSLEKNPGTAFAPLVAGTEQMLRSTLTPLLNNPLDAKGQPNTTKATIQGGLVKNAATVTIKAIDQALSDHLRTTANEAAGEAFSGLYRAAVHVQSIVDAALLQPKPDCAAILQAFGDGFWMAMVKADPGTDGDAYQKAGEAMSNALNSAEKALEEAITDNVMQAFKPVRDAALKAIADILTSTSGVVGSLNSPATVVAIAGKSAFPDDGEEALKELEDSDKERMEYERQLVLIDQGGIEAAELQSIDRMIQKLQRDKLIADLIIASASVFAGLGTSTTNIVNQNLVALTDTVTGEIVGPLKAAKLIVKFAVAMKAANERRILLQKFSKSLDLSKQAVSPMQSTIQGFFNNKTEQVTFHAIEDALTFVQIAAAILGSVPEPITLAVGKTMGAVASGLEGVRKVSEMAYNEKMLSDGWEVTLAAIRNPRDRATGLKALRLNPTLGMHALAWAGTEKQPPDPIARNLLARLGLTEQSLMVSGPSAENKVREYLETLLAEDRTFIDPELISPKWMPKTLELTTESWMVAIHRATTLAKPPLRKGSGAELTTHFKKAEAQKAQMDAWKIQASTGAINYDSMEGHLADAADLRNGLQSFRPVSADGAEHEEMLNASFTFMKMAMDHQLALQDVAAENSRAKWKQESFVADRVTLMNQALEEKIKLAATGDDQDKADIQKRMDILDAAWTTGDSLRKDVLVGRMHDKGAVTDLFKSLVDLLSKAVVAIEELEKKEQNLP